MVLAYAQGSKKRCQVNESEIVKTVRQLAIDLAKHGYSDLSKGGALKLLSHDGTKGGGGVLNQWWNREKDERKKAALRAILAIANGVYRKALSDLQVKANELNRWCDELDTKATIASKPVNDKHAVTKWVRKNRHKYTTNIGSVRAYIEIYGGTLAQLYEIDLKNDLKRNPLSKPKKTT